MANIKSAIKRNRQNEVRRSRNRSFRSEMRTLVKSARDSGTPEDTAAAIKKIDQETKTIFKDSFDSVNLKLKEMFTW